MAAFLSAGELESAYRQYGAMVHRRCRRVLDDDAAADDAVQETFVRAWRYSKGYVGADSKLAWLYRVADRCCFDQLARRRRRPPLDGEPEHQHSPIQAMETRDQALQFLDRFDERVQRLLVLHFIDELSQDQLVGEIGWSRPTIAKKLAWARARAEKWTAAEEKRHG